MPTKRKSQIVMYDHSRAKVDLLQKYLEKYINIIANNGYTQKIHIFDLFCGEGVYPNNGEGSPIAILRTLNDLHAINKSKNDSIIKVDVCFNDKDELKIEKLKSIITERQLHDEKFGQLTYRSKNYTEIVPKLASYIMGLNNEKAFVFIDPYGYKEIRASEIKSLLQSKKSEVLLFLPTQFMYRFDEKGTPQALIEIIEELVDISSWKSTNSVYEFINQFKEALKNYLGADYYVDTFAIEKDPATVFCLFFFSSHIKGFEKMLETKWEIDEDEGKGWSYEKSGDLFSGFKTNPLEEKLISMILTEEKVYNGMVYEMALRSSFLPKHVVEVFSALQAKNKLEVFDTNENKVRKGTFYINYDNYKKTPQKVYFKIV